MKKVSQPNSIRPGRMNERDRLLYVEDDDENWHVAELRLGEEFELVRAANAREACRELKDNGASLMAILMDIELRGSELDGVELTKLLRGRLRKEPLPAYARALQAVETAIGIARPGGAVGRVGVPQHGAMPALRPFFGNVTVGGGPAPVRAYIDELLPAVLDGKIDPGRVFDRTVGLDGGPDGYRAMDRRESIKVMVTP